jgi:hypothetical protein
MLFSSTEPYPVLKAFGLVFSSARRQDFPVPDSPPNPQLPPASTTRVDVRAQASGFFAQRRRGVVQERAPGSLSRADIDRLMERAYADEASPDPPVAPQRIEKRRPPAAEPVARRMSLAQLVARLHEAKMRKRTLAESGDPDGPDAASWDPGDVVQGARIAAGALAHQRRRNG